MNGEIITAQVVALDGVMVPAINPEFDSEGGETHLTFTFPSENGAAIDVDLNLSGFGQPGDAAYEPPGTASVHLRLGGRDARVIEESVHPVHGHAPSTPDHRLLLTLFGPSHWSCSEVEDLLSLLHWLARLPVAGQPVTSLREIRGDLP